MALKRQHDLCDTCDCCGCEIPPTAMLCRPCNVDTDRYGTKIIKQYQLDPEQCKAFQAAIDGKCVYASGDAGTGKTHLLRAIQHYFKGIGLAVYVLGSTAESASEVNGMTIATYAAWTKDVDSMDMDDVCFVNEQRELVFRNTQVLIINDVNLVNSTAFLRLSQAIQRQFQTVGTRGHQPFGGVQLIVGGNFLGLGPQEEFALHCIKCGEKTEPVEDGIAIWDDDQQVSAENPGRKCEKHGIFLLRRRFAFGNYAWDLCRFEAFQLKHNYRKIDGALLDQLASGRPEEAYQTDQFLSKKSLQRDRTTIVYASKDKANAENARRIKELKELGDRKHTFRAVDQCTYEDRYQTWQANFQSIKTGPDKGFLTGNLQHRLQSVLELRRDMLVLLLDNIDPKNGLVAGALGKIVDMVPVNVAPTPSPTAHSAGMIPSRRVQAHKVSELRRFTQAAKKLPVVEFKDGKIYTISPQCWVQEFGLEKPYSLLSRTQLPLVAGYAITVRETIGMVLDTAVMDLQDGTTVGEVYTAATRVRRLQDMTMDTVPEVQKWFGDVLVFMDDLFGVAEDANGAHIEEVESDHDELDESVGEGGYWLQDTADSDYDDEDFQGNRYSDRRGDGYGPGHEYDNEEE